MNRLSKLSSMLALSLLVVAVLACNRGSSKEFSFPADKKDYVGDWRGQFEGGSMKLSIESDGTVNYERKKGSSTKSISGGKITKFDGDDFEVKVLLMSATFKVSKPPYRDGQTWKMVVDDVELSRRDTGSGSNSKEVSIDIAEIRKDDGNGKMSDEVTDTFTESDKTLHRFVTINNPKKGTRIKFVTIAVDGGKQESINESTVTTESDSEDQVRSSLKVTSGSLSKGDYKFEIYLNDKLERTLTFKII